ncbi:hypothetical protein GO491_11030 [Flavobacteriaceae bacterium Ap0902]|nr:hypothetical protein [Flavobacteriaceae bacterium Ap0902]
MNFFKTLMPLFILILVCTIGSCSTTKGDNQLILPEIINPTYKSYSTQQDRGYVVSFEYQDTGISPTEIVLFGIRQSIPSSAIHGNKVNVNMIHQTSTIQNHVIQGSDLPNGIMFEKEGMKYLKEVNFKSKTTLK